MLWKRNPALRRKPRATSEIPPSGMESVVATRGTWKVLFQFSSVMGIFPAPSFASANGCIPNTDWRRIFPERQLHRKKGRNLKRSYMCTDLSYHNPLTTPMPVNWKRQCRDTQFTFSWQIDGAFHVFTPQNGPFHDFTSMQTFRKTRLLSYIESKIVYHLETAIIVSGEIWP